MTELERLRAALVDIAAGGGWQGRHAQAVLDAVQVEQADEMPDTCWYIEQPSGKRIEREREVITGPWVDV